MTKPKEAVQPLHLHKQREITFQELGALLGVRAMLAKGLMTHHPSSGDSYEELLPEPEEHGFNMYVQCTTCECGTVTCIGGAMALLMGLNAIHYVGVGGRTGTASPSLRNLFYPPSYPPSYNADWSAATPRRAVLAIDRWLATGEADWKLPKQKRS